MALADFYNKVNRSGTDLYSERRGRIIREGEVHNQILEKHNADKSIQEIAHMRLHKENITGQIEQLKKDIARGRAADYNPSFLASKEKMLHKLQNDHMHLESEILKAQNKSSAADRVRFQNPHYF